MQTLIMNLRASLRRAPMYAAIKRQHQAHLYRRWLSGGKTLPPPHLAKQMAIKKFATNTGLGIFIETGTYFGDMIHAVKDDFPIVYSIELSNELHVLAKRRFATSPHIHLLQGDSGEVFGSLLPKIHDPCLFWLDGHYSAGVTARGEMETPIEKELAHIARHSQRNRHVILIDDAHCFTGSGDYPSIDRLRNWASHHNFTNFSVHDDIIHISSATH